MNNMIKIFKNLTLVLLLFVSIFGTYNYSFAATAAGQEMRTQVMILADVITNDNNMNDPLTRCEFARMIVKASPSKDGVNEQVFTSVFTDVDATNVYAPFIKEATTKGYISAYLGGLYKPYDFVTYKDLVRACLSLLGYTNEDFTGNQIIGRMTKFTSLKMSENIEREMNDIITKKDAVNAIYNTFKTNKKDSNSAYGPSVFSKMTLNSDGGLNATGLIKTKLIGPFILKKGEAFNLAIPFDLNGANIFINGTSANTDTVYRELKNNGYLIYYYNETTKTVYIYKEGVSLESKTMVKKGIITHIYYSASDTVTPTSVEIDLARYNLANSDVKFAFSYAGTLHVGDQIIFVYTENNNVQGDIVEDDGDVATIGDITEAYIYDLAY